MELKVPFAVVNETDSPHKIGSVWFSPGKEVVISNAGFVRWYEGELITSFNKGIFKMVDDSVNDAPQSEAPPTLSIFSEGSGTKDDPYIIKSADDLQAIGDDMSAHYALGCNIDLSGFKFESIGTHDAPFDGYFDGRGHTIECPCSKDGCLGVFGHVSSGEISNVIITCDGEDGSFDVIESIIDKFANGNMHWTHVVKEIKLVDDISVIESYIADAKLNNLSDDSVVVRTLSERKKELENQN